MIRTCLFVRVSTDDQNYDRQIEDLKYYAINRDWEIVRVISEKISGAVSNDQRTGIQELIRGAQAKEYDKILVTELSRLGRNAYEVNTLIHNMGELGVSIVIQTLGIETLTDNGKTSPMVDLMIAIINQFSQMERQFLIDRINSGIARAKAQGKHLGRKYGTFESKTDTIKKYQPIIKDIRNGVPIRKIAKIHDISTKTVQKVKGLLNGSDINKETKAVE